MVQQGLRRIRAVLVTLLVCTALLATSTPMARAETTAPPPKDWAPKPQSWKPLPTVEDPQAAQAQVAQPKPFVPRKPNWPKPTKSVSAKGAVQRVDVGGLPVKVKAPKGGAEIQVADRAVAEELGVDGVVLSVATVEGEKSAELEVGYAGFTDAGGAGFGERLRLVSLPACALTTPEVAECQVQSPVPSANDPVTQVVSAAVTDEAGEPVALEAVPVESSALAAPASMSVFALAAAGAGSNGSFEASSLASASKWGTSGATGGFTWVYPLIVPPAGNQAEVAPNVSLSYSSAAVDGRIASSNNQPGWIGRGWSYEPGFIERSYVTCADDPEGKAPKRQDLCWQC